MAGRDLWPVRDGRTRLASWNMGFMHDTLQYMARDQCIADIIPRTSPSGLLYASCSENFVTTALSHDEVVHGKGSLLTKMSGDDWQKFANLRAYYTLMWGYPGKKLLFMGQEFAQRREWNENQALDWELRKLCLRPRVPPAYPRLNGFIRGQMKLPPTRRRRLTGRVVDGRAVFAFRPATRHAPTR